MFRSEKNSLRTLFDLAGASQELDLPERKKQSSNLHLLYLKEFENNILTFILTAYAAENAHYNPLMKHLNAILAMLETEVKE